jgi:ferrous iron transport protein B
MSSVQLQEDKRVFDIKNKILLMGPPNVGKSVFFSDFTNIHAISSNYTGTTVSYMKGTYTIDGTEYTLLDVPGTYSLSATSEAEEVAIKFMASNPEAILFVLNAADLEGSIKLLLEVLEHNIPVVAALNLSDVAARKGFAINVPLLEQELGIPVIPTVAVKREGFDEITAKLGEVLAAKQETPAASPCAACSECCKGRAALDYWERAREIVGRVVKNIEKNPSKLDQFGDMLLTPWPGIALALLITLLSLGAVVGAGKALRSVLLLPLVNQGIVPLFEKLFSSMAMPVMLRNVLIGQYGIFRISFEWILALVMPYVLLFQLVFSFLEDSGILPRMAVLFDNMMRKLGVQGGSLINIMLGYGCAVPAIIGTRAATTKKERLMVTSIICFAVPCISQTGALISLLSEFSYWLLLAVFITGCFVFVMTAIISNKVIKGSVDPLIIEIPNLLIPERRTYFKKFFVRVKQFMVEAEGPMMIAVVIAAIIAETGLLQGISGLLEPLVAGWLGLPPRGSHIADFGHYSPGNVGGAAAGYGPYRITDVCGRGGLSGLSALYVGFCHPGQGV